MQKRIAFLLILLTCFLLTSCNSNMKNNSDIVVLNEEIKNLKAELNSLKLEYKKTLTDYEDMKKEFFQVRHENDLLKKSNYINMRLNLDDNFKWLKNNNWDEIIISKQGEDNSFSVPDEFLNNLRLDFIGDIRRGYEPETGSMGYVYTFKKGDKIYNLNIHDRIRFEFNSEFYESTGNLYALIDAFLPYEKEWLKPENILSCIYHSSAYIGEKVSTLPYIFSFQGYQRPKAIASGISCLSLCNTLNKNNLGDPIEVLHFYNHGEVIHVTLYKNYLKVEYENKEYWYEGNGSTTVEYILTTLMAG